MTPVEVKFDICVQAVSNVTGIIVSDILGKRRYAEFVTARHYLMWTIYFTRKRWPDLAKQHADKKTHVISAFCAERVAYLFGMNHATVSHANRKVRGRIQVDARERKIVHEICQQIEQLGWDYPMKKFNQDIEGHPIKERFK